MGGVAELPNQDVAGPSDHQLVAAVRRGDDRAFETLYHRYNRRIQAYVLGMCKDHARAEDITQEVFVSALRRMRETERPIAFKPWIYEIAKNACIDQHRRARRAEEISLQADEGLCPADYGRLVNSDPGPDALVAAKQDLDHLCGAFGGLSETHHDILVMRELEGLSYREIGERLGMSRPAVESTLFRARRRLTEEYDDLVSGQRCLRIQGIIATAATGRLGARDTRRLARHVAHCQPCRREAIAAGLDSTVLRRPLRTRVADRVAALLPFPFLARRAGSRGTGEAAGTAASSSSSGGGGWLAHLPAISDQLGAGWTKAAAAAAVLLAGVGAGVGTQVHRDDSHVAARPPAAHDRGAPAGGGGATASGGPVISKRSETGAAGRTLHRSATKERARAGAAGGGVTGGGTQSSAGGGAGTPAAAPVETTTNTVEDAVTRTTTGSGGDSPTSIVKVPTATPAPSLTTTVQSTGDTVDGAANTVTSTTGAVGGTVDGATSGATAPVTGAVQETTDGAAETVTGLTP